MRPVFFDVDGVLIHGYHARPELRKCWDENMEEDFGISRARFTQEFIFTTFCDKVLTGKQDLDSALTRALPGLGYTGDPKAFIRYWLENDSHVNADLVEKIKILKSSGKVRLFIATNQEHNRARHLMETLGFSRYFERIFYSADIGHLKPKTEYFDYISRNIADTKDPPVFFDDTPEVICAAKQYGWEAYEYKNTDSLRESPFVRDVLETNP